MSSNNVQTCLGTSTIMSPNPESVAFEEFLQVRPCWSTEEKRLALAEQYAIPGMETCRPYCCDHGVHISPTIVCTSHRKITASASRRSALTFIFSMKDAVPDLAMVPRASTKSSWVMPTPLSVTQTQQARVHQGDTFFNTALLVFSIFCPSPLRRACRMQ